MALESLRSTSICGAYDLNKSALLPGAGRVGIALFAALAACVLWRMGTGAALLLLPIAVIAAGTGGVFCGLGMLARRRIERDWARPVATEARLSSLRRAAFQSLFGRSLLIVACLLAFSVGIAMAFPGRTCGVPVQAFILAVGMLASAGLIAALWSRNGWEFDTVVPEAHLRVRLALLAPRARFLAGWSLTSRIVVLREAAALHPGASPAAKALVMALYAPGSVSLLRPEIRKSLPDEIRLRLMGWRMVVTVAGLAALLSLLLMFFVPQGLWDRVFPGMDLSGLDARTQEEDPPPDGDEAPKDGAETAPRDSGGEGAEAGGQAGPGEGADAGAANADNGNAKPTQAGGAASGPDTGAEGKTGAAGAPGAGGEGSQPGASGSTGSGEASHGAEGSDTATPSGAPGGEEGGTGGEGGQGSDGGAAPQGSALGGSDQDGAGAAGAQADSDNSAGPEGAASQQAEGDASDPDASDPDAGRGDPVEGADSAVGQGGDGDIGGGEAAGRMAEQGGEASEGAAGIGFGLATGLPPDAGGIVESAGSERDGDPSADLTAGQREAGQVSDGGISPGQSIPARSEAGEGSDALQEATDPETGLAQELSAGAQAQVFAEDGEVPDAVLLELPDDREEALPGLAAPDPPRQILPAWIKELVN